MTLIDACTGDTSRSEDVILVISSETSMNSERGLEGASPLNLNEGSPHVTRNNETTSLLVNGLHEMVPKNQEQDRSSKDGEKAWSRESTLLPQEQIKEGNASQQENTCGKGNLVLNPGSDASQTSSDDSAKNNKQHRLSNDISSCDIGDRSANTDREDTLLCKNNNGDLSGKAPNVVLPVHDGHQENKSSICLPSVTAAESDSFNEISEESALEVLNQSDVPPDSPATIDVTEITHLELPDQRETLQRPCNFETSLDCTRADALNQKSSTMVRESPVVITPITPSTSVASNSGTDQHQFHTESPNHSTEKHLKGNSVLISETLNRSRTSTATSQSTECSSSGSITTDEQIVDGKGSDFVEVNLQGQSGVSIATDADSARTGAKPKKKGISGFLAKSIFRKSTKVNSSDTVASADVPHGSWGLFGQTPPPSPARRAQQLAEVRQQKGQTHPPTSSNSWKKRTPGMKYASSTTALILENRPSHLPAKNPEEEQRHFEQYEEMIKGAKRKEVKIHKKQLKDLQIQLRHEDGIQMHLQTWQEEILPNWETMKSAKKTRELWWQGIPPSVRGRVWMLAIGNELNITPELFEIFLLRAKDRIKYISDLDSDEESEEVHAGDREDSVDVIKLDVARTFPHLCIFQKGGPYYDHLHSVLGAYACYRPDVGYVQGMSFIAAVFLLYLNPPQAFHCFANLLNKSCQLAFFRLDQEVMQSYFATYEEYFQENMPRLYDHFKEQKLTPDIYIIDWMYTLYIKSLPLDVACVILDVFFRDGEEFLFRTALGILKHYEQVLLQLDFIQIAQYLSKLPSDISSEGLLQSIEEIDMHNQKRFKEVLAGHLAQAITTS